MNKQQSSATSGTTSPSWAEKVATAAAGTSDPDVLKARAETARAEMLAGLAIPHEFQTGEVATDLTPPQPDVREPDSGLGLR